MKLLVIGCNSVLGQVVSLYCSQHNNHVDGLDDEKSCLFDDREIFSLQIEPSSMNAIESIIKSENYDAILNCAAMLIKDSEEYPERADFVNGVFPHYLEELTAGTNTVIVHRSTDCVFSGKKGNYSLNDIPDGSSPYARTKSKGEIVNDKDITIRTSLIGPDIDKQGTDLFNWFINQSEVNGFANSIWTGITTIEYAKDALYLLNNKKHGLFQCVPDKPITKYELIMLFEKYFPRNRVINRVENELVNKALKQEISGTGLHIPSYEEQISEMKEFVTVQNALRPNIYAQYMEDK